MRLLPSRNTRADNSDEQGAHDEDSEDGSSSDEVDEQRLLKDYKNLHWTRLIAIEGYAAGFDRKFALGPDIVEELQALLESEDEGDPGEWQALFDLDAFTEANQPLSLDRFRLSEEELREWAERLTRLRAEIEGRAGRLAHSEPEGDVADQNSR